MRGQRCAGVVLWPAACGSPAPDAVVGPASAPLTPAIMRHGHPAGTVVAPGEDSDGDGAAWGAGDCMRRTPAGTSARTTLSAMAWTPTATSPTAPRATSTAMAGG